MEKEKKFLGVAGAGAQGEKRDIFSLLFQARLSIHVTCTDDKWTKRR
jgi:hypothetical protein